MQALGEHEMLDAWTYARSLHPVDRTLALLAVALPRTPQDQLAALGLGERNGLVLALREQTFGTALVACTACTTCGEQLELAISTRDLLAAQEPTAGDELEIGPYSIVVRRLDSRDLAASCNQPDRERARETLIERAIVRATREGIEIAPRDLDAASIDRIAAHLAQLDPLAHTSFAMTCPACSNQWNATFDPGAYLWSEVAARAQRLVRDIHQLAAIYGWSEPEILAVPAARRESYLELAGLA